MHPLTVLAVRGVLEGPSYGMIPFRIFRFPIVTSLFIFVMTTPSVQYNTLEWRRCMRGNRYHVRFMTHHGDGLFVVTRQRIESDRWQLV